MLKRKIVIFLLLIATTVTSFAWNQGTRSVYLDFRTQVMTMPAMKDYVRKAAASGVNAVIVEWEATFPFEENLTLRNKYAFSRKEVEDFISFCSGVGVEVIPLQNCFGHSEYILRHERYAHLRENKKDFSQVCPMKLQEAELVFGSIFREIAAVHKSDYIHIGCDETRLLGSCPLCREKVSEQGISRLYVDYVSRMCRLVSSLGKVPVIWADILLKYPEAISELPDDLVIVDWNYGWRPDHFGKMENILSSGHRIWGACALRSHPDNLYLVQWRKHLDNIHTYVNYAASNNFDGIINTSWSTSGTYGYIWDDGNVVVDLQPVREVYPISAFALLDDAFTAALNGRLTDVDSFVRQWAGENFGLVEEIDIKAVADYINLKQNTTTFLMTGADRISSETENCRRVLDDFSRLKVRGDASETFRQMQLMLEIRLNYLDFLAVRYVTENGDYSVRDVPELLRSLKRIASDASRLQKRFCRINSHVLKNPYASFNEWTYFGQIHNLTETLENIK